MTRVALVLGLIAATMAGAISDAASRPHGTHARIVVHGSLPQALSQGQAVTISGRVISRPRARRIVLEASRSSSWSVLARGRVHRNGAFSISWSVPAQYPTGSLRLRLRATRGRRSVASTRSVQSTVAPTSTGPPPPPPPSLCAAPSPPGAVPAGDGWITGGVIYQGGPYPGTPRCDQQAYMVTVTASDGTVAASQHVAAGQSYTLVVRAGTYTLQSGACRGTATVQAGRQTQANTYCDVP